MLKENQSRKDSHLNKQHSNEPGANVAPSCQVTPAGRTATQSQAAGKLLDTIRYLHRSGCRWDRLPMIYSPRAPSMTPLPHGRETTAPGQGGAPAATRTDARGRRT